MKKYLITLTIGISLFLVAGPLSAYVAFPEPPPHVSGYVTECPTCGGADGGGPIEGATVSFGGKSCETFDDGYYVLLFGSKVEGTLTVSKPGYATVSVEDVKAKNPAPSTDVCLY